MFPQAALDLEDIGALEVAITGFEDAMRMDKQLREVIRIVLSLLVTQALQALEELAHLTEGAEIMDDAPAVQFYIPLKFGGVCGKATITWQPHCKLDVRTATAALMRYFDANHVQLALHHPVAVDVMTAPDSDVPYPDLESLRLRTILESAAVAGVLVMSWFFWRHFRRRTA